MISKVDMFDFLKKSKLYEVAKDDIDTLIGYMSVRIQEGSLEYLFGFKEMLVKFEDEILWLAGMPGLLPTPPVEEAVGRVKAMRHEYELLLQRFMDILEYGVDRFLDEHLDMVDQYYVRIDDRDKIVDPYVKKKPESFAEMNDIACTDLGLRLIQSGWHKAYGDRFGLYFLREQVGFDRMQFNVEIVSIDFEKLMQAKTSLQGDNYNSLPRLVFEYVDPDNTKDLPVVLPLKKHSFKKIEVTLSHHVQFVFQRNNSPLDDHGKRKRDIYLLKTTVEPHPGFEFLGNIGNYSFEEMCSVVRSSIAELYDLTGIKLNIDNIRLNDVELNLTFRQNCDFNDLMRSVSYYQNYTRKGYVTKEFKAADEEIVYFCANLDDCVSYDQVERKKRRIRTKYSRMKTTGFTTSSKSVTVKLYDKKTETIAYAGSNDYDLKIEGDEALIRLEFKIRNRDQLRRYFGTGDMDVFLWDLSQSKLEKTFTGLVDTFFKKTYENGYVPESTQALIGIVSSLDTSGKGGKWKQDLINAVLSQEIWQKSTPALLTEKDIISVIQYNKTFSRHPKKYQKILMDLLVESDIYKKGQQHGYDMLFNFLNKTYSLCTLSQRRRIGFAVSDPGELLDDKDEEIELDLYVRDQMIKRNNMDFKDYCDL